MERQGPFQAGIIFLAAVIFIGTACCVRFSPYSAVNRYKNISAPTGRAYAMGKINNTDLTEEERTTEAETTTVPATVPDKPESRRETTAQVKKTTAKYVPPKTTAKATQPTTRKTTTEPTESKPSEKTEPDTEETTEKWKLFF